MHIPPILFLSPGGIAAGLSKWQASCSSESRQAESKGLLHADSKTHVICLDGMCAEPLYKEGYISRLVSSVSQTQITSVREGSWQ